MTINLIRDTTTFVHNDEQREDLLNETEMDEEAVVEPSKIKALHWYNN